ncbi:MAG: flagellar basal body P-ring formation chaperone FlgA [Proteobacteria bacterium]|nr:flagellar basal body P-ring formation chaperone FlgA [Pseudomonadota bacterium]
MNAIRIFVSLAAVFVLLASSAQAAPRAYLRANVLVDGDTVKLGDVFDGAGELADRVIANAPRPGQTLVMEADWLYRVARAYRVSWRPASRLDSAIIERRSQIIEPDQLHKTVTEALRRKHDDLGEVEIELDNRTMRLFLPFNMPARVETQSISYDSLNKRFSARVIAPDDRPGAVRTTITGYAYPVVEIPTLSRRMDRDEIIHDRDIEWKTVRVGNIDTQTITDVESLIGLSPRRPITADRAVKESEVQAPVLVIRGKPVTIALTTPTMQLTAMGKALQNGAEGDVVRVQNINSGKIITAVVVGDKRVAVTTLHSAAMQQVQK